jgi:type IV pilus assembly protein PilQ
MKKFIIVLTALTAGFVFAQEKTVSNFAILGKISIEADADMVKIIIPIEKGKVNVKPLKLTDNRLLIDLFPAAIIGKREKIEKQDSPVKEIEISQFQDKPTKTVRIVARCTKPCGYQINEDAAKIVFSVFPEGKDAPAKIAPVKAAQTVKSSSYNKSYNLSSTVKMSGEQLIDSESSDKKEESFQIKGGTKGDVDQIVAYVNSSNADLPSFLYNICAEAGFNLVLSNSVIGTIPSIKLKNVTLGKILDLVLKPNGYTYKVEENIIRVATPAELKAEEENALLFTRTYVLNFAKSAEVQASIAPFLSGKGRVMADVRTNTIIVTDIDIKLAVISELIRKLDSKTSQVSIAAKLVDLKRDISDSLGISWDVRGGGTDTGLGGSMYGAADNVVGRVTVSPPGSAISAGAFQFGFAGSTALFARIDGLVKTGNAKLLANPKITVLDNKTATMNISQSYSYLSAFNAQTGVGTYSSIDAGVSLKVTPQINQNGWVTLEVTPTVGSVVEAGPPPVVDSRSTTTTVLVKDGDTLVIGGMIRDDDIETINKVPILSDIPLIGSFLFSSKVTSKTQRELVVFVTPQIVK